MFCLFFVALCTEVLAQTAYPIPPRKEYPSDNPKASKLDRFVDSLVVHYMQSPENCGLSIAFSENGQHYFYNYGEIKRNSGTVPAKNTLFEISSLTTLFTAELFARAEVEGLISGDDEIRKHLPGDCKKINSKVGAVRLRQLASHTSGLPANPLNLKKSKGYDSLNPYKNYDLSQLCAYLQTCELQYQPGRSSQYSSLAIGLLGLAVEDAYKKTYEELLAEKICRSAGMKNTGVAVADSDTSGYAAAYDKTGAPTPHWNFSGLKAAGALHSTSGDLLAFVERYHEPDDVLKLMQRQVFNDRPMTSLGWFIKKNKFSNTLYWHNAATFGSRSFCGFVKEKKLSVVVLSNSAMDIDFIAVAIMNYLQTAH